MTGRKDPARSVLVLGTHASGKTTFAAQLLGRIRHVQESCLRARALPASLRPYQAALEQIEVGRAPEHTELSLFAETPLELLHDQAGAIDLVWPEYAGETIQRMVASRKVSQNWYERLRASDVWLLFVRLTTTTVPEDVISRRILPTVGSTAHADDRSDVPSELSKQSALVELLQMFVHLRGVATTTPVRRPILGVLLSCFDEVQAREDQQPPRKVFCERIPLLASFVESTWDPGSLVVLGLSSSGRPLSRDQPDQEFVLQGPERQGYVVLPDGRDDPDLTLAVSLPLDRLLHG